MFVRSPRLTMVWLLLAIGAAATVASAQEPSSLPAQDLRAWTAQVPIPDSQWQDISIEQAIGADTEITMPPGRPVVGLGVRGYVHFGSSRGLARIVLIDDRSQEFLVFETYSLVAGGPDVRLGAACRETCLLQPTVPSRLRIELIDASLDLEAVVTNEVPAGRAAQGPGESPTVEEIQAIRQAQETEFVERLNQQIRAKGLTWIAGETDISRLPYAEKERLLQCESTGKGSRPNLQGAEYYVGGVFEVAGVAGALPEPADTTVLIDAFDWRERHGANQPGSPYYDGDATGGGWLTSVKSQRCSDCWAHSALGATEALTNLYFNQHLDVDLSEQELVSCSGAGSCRYGGNTGAALSYVQREGVVDEACFPESGTDEPCANCCLSPQERVSIHAYEYVNPSLGADQIKRKLISSGPLSFGISSWWHGLVLAGYDRDPVTGETIWILKNSWGPGWGDHGYGYVKVPLSDIYLTYRLFHPVTTLTPYSIACRDADGDGYFNWGLSADGALACPTAPTIEDCDDSNPFLARMTEDGTCTAPFDDWTAPILTASPDPAVVWPPGGAMVPVIISGTVTDEGSGVNPGTATYELEDEYGRIGSSGPFTIGEDGTYAFTVMVQASRHKYDLDGRQYTVTVRAVDWAGNRGSVEASVTVPYLMKKEGEPPPKEP